MPDHWYRSNTLSRGRTSMLSSTLRTTPMETMAQTYGMSCIPSGVTGPCSSMPMAYGLRMVLSIPRLQPSTGRRFILTAPLCCCPTSGWYGLQRGAIPPLPKHASYKENQYERRLSPADLHKLLCSACGTGCDTTTNWPSHLLNVQREVGTTGQEDCGAYA